MNTLCQAIADASLNKTKYLPEEFTSQRSVVHTPLIKHTEPYLK